MKTRIMLTQFIDELIYQVVLANRHLSDAAELPDSEYKALRYIDKHGSAKMKDVAKFIGVSLPRTTKIADCLVAGGYIIRKTGKDRRSIELRLSKKGQSVIDEATAMHQDLSEAILSPLSQTQREEMYQLISICHKALREKESI